MKEQEDNRKKVIIRRECDVQMAQKKEIAECCSKDCRNCYCCIETDKTGNREHVAIGRSGITYRNGVAAWVE